MYCDGSWPGLMTYGAACWAAAAYAALCCRNCCCADSERADWGSGCPLGAPGIAEFGAVRPGFERKSCCSSKLCGCWRRFAGESI
uniref:Uncharacterized protein n=1 Tax=Anopheles braziliensis TaxID=58242 RepID=A0A2M3ZM36_9DIPT